MTANEALACAESREFSRIGMRLARDLQNRNPTVLLVGSRDHALGDPGGNAILHVSLVIPLAAARGRNVTPRQK